MDQSEHIQMESFDREYGLRELLSENLASDLLGDLSEIAHISIVGPDGRTYFGPPQDNARWLIPAMETLKNADCRLYNEKEAQRSRVVFPLVHEMENIGFLVLCETEKTPVGWIQVLGPLIAKSVNHLIYSNYQNHLTSGLHHQVVEDSYAGLKEKARQLQESETKYRKLAERLEEEVKRKSRKIIETQLMMLQQEKLAAIGQLAAGMAHEINNPIGFIISNLNTLSANTQDLNRLLEEYGRLIGLLQPAESKSGYLERIVRQVSKIKALRQAMDIDFLTMDVRALIAESLDGAERIKTIVQTLREFTHPSVETLEVVNINHCLETTLSILSPKIHDGLKITTSFGELPNVQCQLREINQVFFNIIVNAIQAVGDRGEIAIATRQCDTDQVEIAISDTGPGIAKSHLSHIFDPFFTTRDVGGGMGLGLYLVHNIIKKHCGTIDVQSKEGTGSTFRIKLPVESTYMTANH